MEIPPTSHWWEKERKEQKIKLTLGEVKFIMESLILAQDERWRYA
jgi:hypothetical protein